MTRSLRLAAVVLSVFVGIASLSRSIAAAEIAGRRPNIVLLITDDQGYGDLSCHGNPILKTPNLDRMHAEGVRFTDFHVSPTCSPTRASLMSGRHEFKNGVTHTILERERMSLKTRTLAEILKGAGYSTGIFGKWHLGDEAEYQPNRRGFDEVFIHGAGGIGQSYPGTGGDAPGNSYFNPVILHNGTFEKTQGYCTDVFFRQAMQWVEEKAKPAAETRQPFFCYIATNAPHGPLHCPEEYIAKYRGKVPAPTAPGNSPSAEDVAKFYGMIANIDDNVGRLLTKLEELEIDRDTLFIFMNDNGGTAGVRVFNAGMRGGKGTPFRGGTRGASFWRWPGTLKPADCDRLAAHIDYYPTLAAIAGAEIPDEVVAKLDGRSLVPLLTDPLAEWADRLIFTHVGRWNKGTDANFSKYAQCAVRDARFQLVSVRNQPPGPDPARAGGAKQPRGAAANGAAVSQPVPKNWQLFDLKADPGETKNIAAEHPEVVARLEAAYDRWWAEVVPETLENERAPLEGPNPFRALYEKQFGPVGK